MDSIEKRLGKTQRDVESVEFISWHFGLGLEIHGDWLHHFYPLRHSQRPSMGMQGG